MSEIPAPPDGYSSPEPYGETSLKKSLGSAMSGILPAGLSYILLDFDSTISRAYDVLHTEFSVTIGVLILLFTLGLLVILTVPVHESIHYFILNRMGYHPEYIWELPNPKVVTENEFVRRNHNIISLISPLVVLSCALIPAYYLLTSPLLLFSIGFIIIWNAGASGSDIFGVVKLFREPPDLLTYTVWREESETYFYRPRGEE